MYGKITKPFWDDRPVAVIGGGPSMLDFDYERLRGAHVLAIKRSIFDIPWADAGYGIDMRRYNEWRGRLANVQSRIYWALSEDDLAQIVAPTKNITLLKRLNGQGLSDDPGVIYGGGTSAFGAMQICIHKRAKQIVLFGFDFDGAVYESTGNGGPHYEKRRERSAANWSAWAEHFSVLVPYLTRNGIHVVNACPASAIRCFQKVTIGDGVELCRSKVAA